MTMTGMPFTFKQFMKSLPVWSNKCTNLGERKKNTKNTLLASLIMIIGPEMVMVMQLTL